MRWRAWLWALLLPAAGAAAGPAPRVVSLAPSLTELMYAMELDAYLVGRSSACDYPDAATAVPVVGGFGRPNWEALWQQRPDLVLATDLEKPGLREQLAERGVDVLLLPCESWNELRAAATAIGDALDQPESAQAWRDGLDRRLAALQQRVARLRGTRPAPSIYVEVWGSPIMTAGRDSFLNEIIRTAGARPVGASLRGRYQAVSSEWVLKEDPDVILLAYMLADLQPADRLAQRLGWGALTALKQGRVIDGIHPDLLLRPGPRLIDGVEQLVERLWALPLPD
jgi:iron complex transport system substrate-binding protein